MTCYRQGMCTYPRPFRTPFDLLSVTSFLAALLACLLFADAAQGVELADAPPADPGFGASVWQAVAPQLVPMLAAIIVGGITWLTRLGYGLVKRLIETRVQNEHTRGLLERLTDAVYTAVKSTEGRVAAEVRKAAADGKITPEEREAIRKAALADVQALLGPKGIADLAYVLGLPGAVAPGTSEPAPPIDAAALEAALAPRLEAALVDLKNAGAVARPTSPASPPSP